MAMDDGIVVRFFVNAARVDVGGQEKRECAMFGA